MPHSRHEMTPHDRRRDGMRRYARLGAGTLGLALALVAALAFGQAPAPHNSLAPATGEWRMDGYVVRWNTTVTGFLPRQTVETHGLRRSGRGVLNVVVLREAGSGPLPETVAADVSARVRNLRGQVQRLDMHPIEANDRISYLGTFEVDDRDQLRFELQVHPPGGATVPIVFERRFLID
jgi:hypothetical protein